MKKKTTKNKKSKPNFQKLLAATGVAAICLSALGYFVYNLWLQPVRQNGQLDVNQTSRGENLHTSLDLRLASKAAYPSSPITLVKDLGVSDGVRSQIISFSVPDDNLTEYGLMYLPASAKPAAGFPLVILCHGYIKPADYSTTLGYTNDMSFYARNGFAVIKPDFRGQGLSADQGVADSVYYSMAYNTDVMSLISAVKDTSYLDKNNINLWGHSMGAYIALRAAVVSPDIKTAILLAGPAGSLNQDYISYIPPSDENNPVALKTRQAAFSKYGTPGENTVFWKYASPTTFLANTSTNFDINVGLLDPVVPPALSADLDANLTALHRSHEYYVYDQGRHNLFEQRPQIWSRSLVVLKNH